MLNVETSPRLALTVGVYSDEAALGESDSVIIEVTPTCVFSR